MEIIAYKVLPIVFFVDDFLSHFALPTTVVQQPTCHFRNIEVESNDDSHLESFDALGPGRWILRKKLCFLSLTVKR